MNISCIIVDKAIPGIVGPAYNKCTTLAEVLAALAGAAGVDVYAVSGVYDAATESIVITLSNGSTFAIPAALLLPVVADGVTIMGNGTTGSPLVGYQVAYNAGTGALTITAPGGAPVVIAQQTATTEPATDTHNVLGNGAGTTATTQQLLDTLAAASHPRATAAGGSNPALTINPATQVATLDLAASGSYDNSGSGLAADNVQSAINELAAASHPAATVAATSNPGLTLDPITQVASLDLDAAGSYDNTISGLSASSVQDAIDELAQCCPDNTLEIPFSAFADPLNPTQSEAQGWIDAQGSLSPGTQIIYNRTIAGDVEDPEYVWLVNPIGDAPNIKKPVCCPDPTVLISDYELVTAGQPQTSDILAKIAANGPYAAGTLLKHIGNGTVETPNSVWQIDPAGVPIRIEANSIGAWPIPVVAFADPDNPTTSEAFIWAVTTGPYPPNTLFTYVGTGTTDPDYVWENDASGALIKIQDKVLIPLPVAAYTITSKIGIMATLEAGSSSGTQIGNTLAYHWSANGPGGVTFGAQNGASTGVTFASPGAYILTLTVTDGNGNLATQSQVVNVARVLEVNSPDTDANDYLATVTAALAWKAANDAGNSYEIMVYGQVTEPAAITNADRAHIHYVGGASSTFAASSGYVWTVAPVDMELTGTTKDPYNPAVIVSGGANTHALSISNLDASNLKISQMAFARLGGNNGGRAIDVQSVSNLRMFNVGFRAVGSVYTTFFHQTNHLYVEDCSAIGDGVPWGISTPLGVTNAKLVKLYGELSDTPESNANSACYLPGTTVAGTANDLALINCTFVNRAAGNSSVGLTRTPIYIGGSALAGTNGLKIIGCQLLQMIAANPLVRSTSVQAERNTLHFVGNVLSGGTGTFFNCAPNPAAVVNATNAILV